MENCRKNQKAASRTFAISIAVRAKMQCIGPRDPRTKKFAMRSPKFLKRTRHRNSQCCEFWKSRFPGAPCIRFLHLNSGFAKKSRWPCPPQHADSLECDAAWDDPPMQIGRRPVLFIREKALKNRWCGVSILPE